MTTITTKLVKDGNSVAIRLPKPILALSGLRDSVQMEVKNGQITLRPAHTGRAGWKEHIAHTMATDPAASTPDEELTAWDTTTADGIDQIR